MSGTRPGESGGRTSASGSGGRCARTTARTATRGSTSPTTTRGRARTTGERTGSRASATSKQRLCFALALWNGKDPILKERLFGLSNAEGNHGEDVKEYYFYLDSTPTHSYMKWLYKYPQAAFPYDDLVKTNARRTRQEFEYELIDTGVFDDDRYFDVVVEYAKSSPEECFIRITVDEPRPGDRDDSSAADAVVPQHVELVARRGETAPGGGERTAAARASWRRRTRSSAIDGSTATARRRCCSPRTTRTPSGSSTRPTRAPTSRTPSTRSSCTGRPTPSTRRRPAPRPPPTTASRSAPASRWRSGSASPMRRRRPVRSRPSRRRSRPGVARRTSSTDPARRSPPARTPRSVMRQAFGGLFWTKQYYFFDVNMWLREHGVNPFDVAGVGPDQEPPLVPHVQRRRHLDAGQVGVPVVRRLGSRLSRGRAGAASIRTSPSISST